MTDVVEPTEITELDVEKVSAVAAPANGTGFLLIKGAAAPVAKARESQSSDHDVEAITGSAVAGATCNAPCADGSMCSRSPAAGSARCHHHQGVALTLKSKGTDMEATKQLLEAGVSPEHVAQLVENAAAFKKGQVQDRLNGGDTPELGGDIRMGNPGSLSPAQGSVSPKITATTTPNGLPGLVSSLEGGESAYQVNAGAEVNAGAGPSLTDMVRGRSQTLPAPPAGSNTLRGSVPGAVKEALAKARADVVETERAFKEAEQERGPLAAMSLERAGEAATRAALKEQALAQFGPR